MVTEARARVTYVEGNQGWKASCTKYISDRHDGETSSICSDHHYPHIQVANAFYVQLCGFSGEGESTSYCRTEVVPVHCVGTAIYSQVFGSCNGETKGRVKDTDL